jgi:hypothetical protein
VSSTSPSFLTFFSSFFSIVELKSEKNQNNQLIFSLAHNHRALAR